VTGKPATEGVGEGQPAKMSGRERKPDEQGGEMSEQFLK
jgi:hypothetical protein